MLAMPCLCIWFVCFESGQAAACYQVCYGDDCIEPAQTSTSRPGAACQNPTPVATACMHARAHEVALVLLQGGHHHDMGGHPHGSTHCPPAGKNCSGLEDPTATGTTGWPAGCKVEQVAPGTVCTDTCATNFNLVTTVAVCQLNGTWQIVDTNALCEHCCWAASCMYESWMGHTSMQAASAY
jgi:hypothetical protein